MKLGQLLDALLERTSLRVSVADIEISEPSNLSDLNLHHSIADATINACLQAGLPPRGAYAFGEWLAGLITGWSTRFGNETDVLKLEQAFSVAAFNNDRTTIRCYCAPNWDAFFEHLPQTQLGVSAAFELAKALS